MDDPGPNFILAQLFNLAETASATDGLVFKIILLVVLIFINAFFAMSEIAIISLNDTKIERMAEEGHKKAKMVLKLTSNSTRFLSTIQIGVTLAGFLSSASASTAFAAMLTDAIKNLLPGVSTSLISGVSVVVITLITSYFSLVLGELAPKKIGMQASEKVAFAVVKPLLVISKITAPFVKFLSLSTNGVVRLFGFDPNASEEVVTEEEIRMMVDVGGEKGVIEDTQKEMINNIFEFGDLTADEVLFNDFGNVFNLHKAVKRVLGIDFYERTLRTETEATYLVNGNFIGKVLFSNELIDKAVENKIANLLVVKCHENEEQFDKMSLMDKIEAIRNDLSKAAEEQQVQEAAEEMEM